MASAGVPRHLNGGHGHSHSHDHGADHDHDGHARPVGSETYPSRVGEPPQHPSRVGEPPQDPSRVGEPSQGPSRVGELSQGPSRVGEPSLARRDEPHGDEHGHGHDDHDDDHDHDHGGGAWSALKRLIAPHSHDAAESVDDALVASGEGIRAVQISLIGLGLTAALQLAVALASGSVAVLADTIHNFADASTALPLWLAFSIGRKPANPSYTYGYGRAEDLAGVFVLLMIVGSAAVAFWESLQKLLHPSAVEYLPWVAAAGLAGFAGNEAVAQYRIRVGERIGSAALVADGYHARTDGLTSLAVLVGAAGVWLGVPLADPVVGLLITVAILVVLKDAGLQMWRRLMDAVDPHLVAQAAAAAGEAEGVESVSTVRARWIGHTIHAEALIVARADLSLEEAHQIAERARHNMLHAVPRLSSVTVHVDPSDEHGRDFHADLAHHDYPSA